MDAVILRPIRHLGRRELKAGEKAQMLGFRHKFGLYIAGLLGYLAPHNGAPAVRLTVPARTGK